MKTDNQAHFMTGPQMWTLKAADDVRIDAYSSVGTYLLV